MLQLKNIVKTYVMGDTRVQALKGIDIEFRKNDFVSILGPSGCGKTTMLNIIGGLDRYTSGDLVINEISTKEYKDVDWDIYRNNSIGFVFQSYNLISHQTVYTNVELALTLAGISPAERKKRVLEVLEKVGLADQIYKKPTQMSGGQMQRVAIARALVNNPDILLADEPTGALDSGTSVQIMELLKEIAKDRLVIMVTHNSDIAEKYSTRIIKLLDGEVVGDTNPYSSEQEIAKREKKKRKKISMSFPTALSLSFKNLMTKKTRTILTSFAGSIGIIGIALILSLSSGMQEYISNLERDTLSTYPLELRSQTMDMSSMMSIMMEHNRERNNNKDRELDKIYSNTIMTKMIQSMTTQIKKNDLKQFKQHLESDDGKQLVDATNTIQYGYNIELQIFNPDTTDITQINPSTIFSSFGGNGASGSMNSNMGMGMGMGANTPEIWTEMLGNDDLLRSQYDVIAGDWPQAHNEIVLIVNKNNELNDMVLYSLGLLDRSELEELMKASMKGEEYQTSNANTTFTYDEILELTYKLILNTDYYVQEDNGWVDKREDTLYMKDLIENALELKVVGILRPTENAAATSIGGSIGYTFALTDHVINEILKTDIAQEQLAAPDTNVLTGVPFDVDTYVDTLTMDDVRAMAAEMPESEQAQAQAMLANMTEEEIIKLYAERIKSENKVTYEDNLTTLGIADFDSPSVISLYPKDFESKKQIETSITEYNKAQEDAGRDEQVINYTDIVGIMTSSMSDIINIISYVLIAFVAISLVVSSIMIAIITYISVLERTKEIGILRSIGASKKDITRVFNAETIIEGFVAGTMGILITILLNFPINAIIHSLTGISNVSALPVYGAVGLILISMILTVISGFIPSKMAAKKDPVTALRTE
ncbi:MAG: ABC transporter ATP-binding protein/permease [Peptococcaceae bacterium]|nr:ABC transporter ATP-binding protein/permease [Peptococcaceae bacterium]